MEIKKIFLETTVPEKIEFFYKEILGLQSEKTHEGSIVVHAGSSRLYFTKHENDLEPYYHFAFTIPYNKIEKAKEWMKGKAKLLWIDDYQSDIAEFVNWNARSIYFYDPQGNIVEFIGRKDFCLQTEGNFTAVDILSISEIGIVYQKENYQEEIASIMEDWKLDYFSRQKPLPGFSALGDDAGLLIAVYNDRNWYPTTKRSGMYSLKVEVAIDGKLFVKTIS